jgi:hypothetical protein
MVLNCPYCNNPCRSFNLYPRLEPSKLVEDFECLSCQEKTIFCHGKLTEKILITSIFIEHNGKNYEWCMKPIRYDITKSTTSIYNIVNGTYGSMRILLAKFDQILDITPINAKEKLLTYLIYL